MITIIKAVSSKSDPQAGTAGRDRPGILSSKSLAVTGSEEAGEKPLNIPGSAELNLPEHSAILAERLAQLHQRQTSEIRLVLSDGDLLADSIVLAGVSPFLKQLLQEAVEGGPGEPGWVRDEFPVLFLPDVSRQQMKVLLSLLYTGSTRLVQRELSSLVTLTHLLKLISIPVAIVDDPPADRRTRQSRASRQQQESSRATITFLPEKGGGRGRPAKMMTTATTARPEVKKTESQLSFTTGVVVEAKKTRLSLPLPPLPSLPSLPSVTSQQDRPLLLPEVSESESELEEFVEEMQVFVSDEGTVERLELLSEISGDKISLQSDLSSSSSSKPVSSGGQLDSKLGSSKKPGGGGDGGGGEVVTSVASVASVASVLPHTTSDTTTVTVVQTEEGEGLDNLISVAEAFERSQQPDFNDIASPVVDGTDTERLVRNCWICKKSLLGRNALGRHMKNVHPAVFGPYRCSHDGCGKLIESGVKMVSHMNHHALSKTRVTESDGATDKPAEEQRKKKQGEAGGKKRPSLECNAGEETCRESFSTARGFIKHMKEQHGMKPWYCGPCDKRFMERQNLQFHMMSCHENKKNFACDICNKSFANPRQLYTHRALHLGKRFLCQECGYRARSSANLRGHVKARHEARQHNCPLCGKKFSSANNLKNHMRIHTGESPYICQLCGVSFKRAHHLHSHIESKMHLDVMEKARRKGQSVPHHLDPLRRARGRPMVEDGPVTLANHQPQLETHITEVTDQQDWGGAQYHQVVVVEETPGGSSDFSIPVEQVEQAEIEIIDDTNILVA